MNENKLTSEEKKALLNFFLWFAVKIGMYVAVQSAIRSYIERNLSPNEEQNILRARMLINGELKDVKYP